MPWNKIRPENLVSFVRETAAATWAVDADGYVLDVPEWTALTGQTAAEAEGDGWMTAIHPDDVDRVAAAWKTAVAHGSHYNTDYRLRCADGSYRWFNARGVPVQGVNGETTSWIGVILAIPGASRPSRSLDSSRRTRPADQFEDISPAALRAARAILNWPADKLAERAGVARSTIRRLEDDAPSSTPRKASVQKILAVLAAEGVRFLGSGTRVMGILDPRASDPGDAGEVNADLRRSGQTLQ
jgi:PAS domain S-box-containing protein